MHSAFDISTLDVYIRLYTYMCSAVSLSIIPYRTIPTQTKCDQSRVSVPSRSLPLSMQKQVQWEIKHRSLILNTGVSHCQLPFKFHIRPHMPAGAGLGDLDWWSPFVIANLSWLIVEQNMYVCGSFSPWMRQVSGCYSRSCHMLIMYVIANRWFCRNPVVAVRVTYLCLNGLK